MGSGNSGDILCTNKVGTFGKEACFNINISIGSSYLVNHSVIGGDFINCTYSCT